MIKIDSIDFENARYEKKFAVRHIDEKEICKIISVNPAIFSEIFQERQVNSIYFDSPDMQNLFNHSCGNASRLKIRIRWYGKIFASVKSPVLEIKIKRGEVGKKLSYPLKDFILDKEFSYDAFKKEVLAKSNLPKGILESMKAVFPVSLVSYKRKYFISANKKCRLTLDKDICFYKLKESNNYFLHKIEDKELKIIEMKFNQEAEKSAREIMQGFPLRLGANSKYVSGLIALEF